MKIQFANQTLSFVPVSVSTKKLHRSKFIKKKCFKIDENKIIQNIYLLVDDPIRRPSQQFVHFCSNTWHAKNPSDFGWI